MSDNIRVTREGSTTTITLARPEKRNALSAAMMTDLHCGAGRGRCLRRSPSSSRPMGRSSRPGTTSATWPGPTCGRPVALLLCTLMMDTVRASGKVHALATAARVPTGDPAT